MPLVRARVAKLGSSAIADCAPSRRPLVAATPSVARQKSSSSTTTTTATMAIHDVVWLVAVVIAPSLVSAFSFNINSAPQQCSNISLSITGSGGSPPYSALVIPFGSSPLANNVEVRKIVENNFTGTSTSFAINYPTDSQYVLVVCSPFAHATTRP